METFKISYRARWRHWKQKAELVLKMHVSSMYLPSQWKKGILPIEEGRIVGDRNL